MNTSELPTVHHFLHLNSPWGQLVVRMPSTKNTSKLFLVLVSLLLVLPVVEALDAGDTIAFLLGLAVSVIGFCACLGFRAQSNGYGQVLLCYDITKLSQDVIHVLRRKKVFSFLFQIQLPKHQQVFWHRESEETGFSRNFIKLGSYSLDVLARGSFSSLGMQAQM
ncbi:hypothetical protein IHE44_0012399 [Lamprotornis superbus]|uniref:Uncharacterized protein n=1 Tax=Lamprotornis superbus TaxID=245042 RepID=A0A835NRN9_9PASS|nr:hypothetical protein IHE44_0012399 [Lamprotornis superbus]